jgi:hypothetical protein
MKHTPEPWAISSTDPFLIVDRHGNDVAAALSMYSATRIVACVNACAGMESPEEDIKRYKKALSSCLYYLQKIANMPEYRQDEINYLSGRGVLELEHALPDIFPDL